MRVIIAPAKKMNPDLDSSPPEALPQFLDRTERLRVMDLFRRLTPAVLWTGKV